MFEEEIFNQSRDLRASISGTGAATAAGTGEAIASESGSSTASGTGSSAASGFDSSASWKVLGELVLTELNH